ncbi:MAG: hypothetical protein IPF68_17210 [Bacteroidales bacterium]|nr:hypothetical protein [Bacteroidales bacterium]
MTLFNFVSVETFQDPRVDDNSKAKWLSDSTFLLGFQNINSNNHEQDIAFSEIDSTLLLRTVSVIGALDTIDYMPANVGIDFVNPDSIHYAGTKNIIPEFWPQESSWIRVGLLDRTLEPLYERFYGGDAYYKTLSIMRTRDGGTFIAALRYNYLEHNDYNDAFFLKVNNEGLVTNLAMSPICPLESFIIYPNPGTDYINLILSENSAKIKIFDMNRKEILSKNAFKWSE